jgi:hypothetical protein
MYCKNLILVSNPHFNADVPYWSYLKNRASAVKQQHIFMVLLVKLERILQMSTVW